MIRGGFKRKPNSYSYVYTNEQVFSICKTIPLDQFISVQQRSYVAHVIRLNDNTWTKRLLFSNEPLRIPGQTKTILQTVTEREDIDVSEFIKRSTRKEY